MQRRTPRTNPLDTFASSLNRSLRHGVFALVAVVVFAVSCSSDSTATATTTSDDGPQPTTVAGTNESTETTPTTMASADPSASTDQSAPDPTAQASTATADSEPTAQASDDTEIDPTQASCPTMPTDQPFDIVGVLPSDPDGGLVVHSEPGVDAPVVGVLPWDLRGVAYSNDCTFVPDGGEWWVISVDSTFGWVNAAYLGDRPNQGDAFVTSPCSDAHEDAPSERDAPRARTGEIAVSKITVMSSSECDRVVIDLKAEWSFQTFGTQLGSFPADAFVELERRDHEVELVFNDLFATAFDSVPPARAWRDVVTDEQNVVLAIDREYGRTLHVGFGTGSAAVRFVEQPARIVIDVFQTPSPAGTITGPIVGPGRFANPVLLEPIQRELTGDGVVGPVTVRGWSRGFEASSYFDIRTWDQTEGAAPLNWQANPFTFEVEDAVPDVTFMPPLQQFGGDGWPFMTAGYFEYTIDSLVPGAYQIAVGPSSGRTCSPMVGQQFRVAGSDLGGNAPAATFAMTTSSIGQTDAVDFTVTTNDGQTAFTGTC